MGKRQVDSSSREGCRVGENVLGSGKTSRMGVRKNNLVIKGAES